MLERFKIEPFVTDNRNVRYTTDLFRSGLKEILQQTDPQDMVTTWKSARRVGMICAERDLSLLPIPYIQEELRCQGIENSNYSEECLRNLERITLAVDPVVELFMTMNLEKRVSDKRIDPIDLLDYAKKYVQKLVYWNVDPNEILNPNIDNITDYFLVKLYGNMKYIPKMITQDWPIISSYDDLEDLLPNEYSENPENILVKKEEAEEFFKKLSQLPSEVLNQAKQMINEGNPSPAQRELLTNIFSTVLGWEKGGVVDKSRRSRKKYPSRQLFGVVDESGISVFYNLSPSQALWLTGRLTRCQQLAIFEKLGYLDDVSYKRDFNVKSGLFHAKTSIVRLRKDLNSGVPSFEKTVPIHLASLIENSENNPARTLGHNQIKVLNYFTQNPSEISSLQGIDFLVVTILMLGKSAYTLCEEASVSKDIVNHTVKNLTLRVRQLSS